MYIRAIVSSKKKREARNDFEKLALKTWNESLGKDETFVRRVKFCLVKMNTLSEKLSLKYHPKWGIPGQNNFFSYYFRK